jgi:hypothetical protein
MPAMRKKPSTTSPTKSKSEARQQDPLPRPAPVDARVRGPRRDRLVDEKGGSWWEVVTRFTLEVEGNDKPCFVGDSLTRVLAPGD